MEEEPRPLSRWRDLHWTLMEKEDAAATRCEYSCHRVAINLPLLAATPVIKKNTTTKKVSRFDMIDPLCVRSGGWMH